MLKKIYRFSNTLNPSLIIDFFLKNTTIKLLSPTPSPNSSPKIPTLAPEAADIEESVFDFEL